MTQPYAVCMLNIKTHWLKEKGGKIYTADKNYKKGGVQTSRTFHNAKVVDIKKIYQS